MATRRPQRASRRVTDLGNKSVLTFEMTAYLAQG